MSDRLDDERRKLVEDRLWWADKRARRRRRRAPRFVPTDDLISAARLGLCKAAARWRGESLPQFLYLASLEMDVELDRTVGSFFWGSGCREEQLGEKKAAAIPAPGDDEDDEDSPVIRAFRVLGGREREALERVVIRGEPHRTAAEAMGTTRGEILGYLRKGYKLLRVALAS